MLMTAAPVAWGQIAVPELAPAAPRIFNSQFPIPISFSYTTINPAVIQWGSPMRLGGGWIEGQSHDDILLDSKTQRGQFAGGRMTLPTLAVGGELGWLSGDYPLAPAAITQRHGAGGISFAALPELAVGLSATRDHEFLDTAQNDTTDITNSRTLGFSWRVKESIFLGLAYGKDYLKRTVTNQPEVIGFRSFHMVGAGIRGGGKMLWRMEVSTTNRKDFLGTNGLSIKPGYMLNQGSLELGAANMFIGYTTYNAKEKSNGPTLKGGIADFSISFMRGIGITGRYEKNQVNTAAMENAKWERVKSITASMMY